jgi:hypothetical protein
MAKKYRGGGTAAQRRAINPPTWARTGQSRLRLVPVGMPLEHLMDGLTGHVVGNVPPEAKQPSLARFSSHTAPGGASIRQVYNCVPENTFIRENGWLR